MAERITSCFRAGQYSTSTLLGAAAFVAVLMMQSGLDKFVPFRTAAVTPTVPSLVSVQLMSGGFERVWADFFWLAFIQYVGDQDNVNKDEYSHSYPYVDLITQLDPHFEKPYWFGCWTIGHSQGRPDLVEGIIDRGMQANPKLWSIPYIGGWNEFLFAKNVKKAAWYYQKASTLPDAPEYLKREAAILATNVPEYEKRYRTLLHIYNTTKDESLKADTVTEIASVLKAMYNEAPTDRIKRFAHDRLIELGFSEQEIGRR